MQLQAVDLRYTYMNARDTSQSNGHGPSWNGAGEWPFDVWLRRALADGHDDALQEQLPAEWLALVDQGTRTRPRR
jgi:hypothetical protein